MSKAGSRVAGRRADRAGTYNPAMPKSPAKTTTTTPGTQREPRASASGVRPLLAADQRIAAPSARGGTFVRGGREPGAKRHPDAVICERCGAEMFRMHAVWRCPECRYKTDCCGW